MRISLRHFHVVMPQKFLHGIQIRPRHHQSTGERVTEIVPMKVFDFGRLQVPAGSSTAVKAWKDLWLCVIRRTNAVEHLGARLDAFGKGLDQAQPVARG